ncbi:MAG TPA: tripartite tricarboxylate transporter substrate-binding protein [Candidatus Limnocylindria bacterium]|nr:tripartite tricarboxylate transporter substrate-binding protein [Candidatus Limnocylindria bacterium]
MMRQRSFWVVLVALGFVWSPSEVIGQEPFYKGKTVRIIVGGSAGGGYDTYTRAIARHLGKHVPGNPVFVVENMTGAGSLISANHVYKVAKPDGLTIGHFIGGLMLQHVLGRPGIEFDGRKFEHLGVPAQDTSTVAVTKESGVTSIDNWLASKTTLKFGGVGPGAATDDVAKVVRATVGAPIQLVSGYKGTADIKLAVNSGELQGLVNSWESFKSGWVKEIEGRSVILLLQVYAGGRHPELPKVPSILDYVKSDEGRKIVQTGAYDYASIARPYVFPPGTPKDRVAMLRKGLADTYKDPEFLADAKKARLDMAPLSGEELEKIVERTYNLDKNIVEKLREILK